MNLFDLNFLLFSIAITLFLKDELNVFQHLKIKMGYEPTEEVKPFDCYFCLLFWASVIASIITLNFYLLPLGYIIATIIDGIKRF